MKQTIAKAIAETGAGSIKDMGHVMGCLKSHYAGQMDFHLPVRMLKPR